ncbi:MAG: RnfABCDGE type electron transport complex subunit B [bacterium]|nr:RnfABCDGE type electron transport complex subunit B [bacterium]
MIEAIISLSGLGLVAGLGLAVASKVFAVHVDPKVAAIDEALLGTNCGACGFPGCAGLAAAIASGEAKVTDCLPGGEAVAKAVAAIMGVDAEVAEKEVAVVLCKGGDRDAKTKFDYRGVKDCWAAMQVGGGFKSCSYGCLGLGSCYKVCEFGAIEITEDRLAIIKPEKCVGCTLCVAACPKEIIRMVPESQKVHVLCSSHDKGPATKKICSVGCIGCTLCVKKTTNMTMDNNLAVVDYSVLDNAHDPAEVCPTNTISDYNQAHPLERFKKAKKGKPAKKVAKADARPAAKTAKGAEASDETSRADSKNISAAIEKKDKGSDDVG